MIRARSYFQSSIATPIGKMNCLASNSGISLLLFEDNAKEFKQIVSTSNVTEGENHHLSALKRELSAYFEGTLKSFNVELDFIGSTFQKDVWSRLMKIPYGATMTYGQLADDMGDRKKIRAVANANARNQIMIIIPCHRIIGSGSKLTGYRGGIERKRWLINFEQQHTGLPFLNTLF